MMANDGKYLSLLENVSDSVTIRSWDGRIIEANPAACQLLGYNHDELCVKNFMDLIAPECHDRLNSIRETLMRTGFVDYETFFIRKDGSKFQGEARCVVIQDQDVVMCISRDVSKRKQIMLELNEFEEKYRLIVETANEGIVVADDVQQINYVNQKTVDLLGYEVDEIVGLNIMELVYKDDLLDYDKRVENRKRNIAERFERRFIHKNGSVRWMIVSVTPLQDNGKFIGSFAMLTDITDIKLAEVALRDSEEKYRLVVESAAEAIFILDNNGIVVDVNNKLLEISNLERGDVVGQNFTVSLPKFGIDAEDAFEKFIGSIQGKKFIKNRFWTALVKGRQLNFISHASKLIRDGEIKGMSIILEDVTERLDIESRLRDSLKEKERLLLEKDVLLKEIHHRVKNNLQIISSLLNLQSVNIVNEHDKKIFLDSKSRIKSMAIVHEQLYQSEDLSRIDIENYIKRLADSLFNSYNVNPLIRFNLDVENVKFGVNTAIPLGLMINEFLTNSLKHAFPCIYKGQVSLTNFPPVLSKNATIMGDYCQINLNLSTEDGKYILVISDNGVGLPRDLDYRNTSTLGFQLINSLVNQLDGIITLDRTRGTEFRIEFQGS
jgi:PAS domain S-box-containing protein